MDGNEDLRCASDEDAASRADTLLSAFGASSTADREIAAVNLAAEWRALWPEIYRRLPRATGNEVAGIRRAILLPGVGAKFAILDMVSSKVPWIRRFGFETLASSPTELGSGVRENIALQGLLDPDDSVRALAAEASAGCAASRCASQLLLMVGQDPNAMVRLAAAFALVRGKQVIAPGWQEIGRQLRAFDARSGDAPLMAARLLGYLSDLDEIEVLPEMKAILQADSLFIRDVSVAHLGVVTADVCASAVLSGLSPAKLAAATQLWGFEPLSRPHDLLLLSIAVSRGTSAEPAELAAVDRIARLRYPGAETIPVWAWERCGMVGSRIPAIAGLLNCEDPKVASWAEGAIARSLPGSVRGLLDALVDGSVPLSSRKRLAILLARSGDLGRSTLSEALENIRASDLSAAREIERVTASGAVAPSGAR